MAVRGPKSGASFESSRAESFPAFSSCWRLQAFLGLWHHNSSLCLHLSSHGLSLSLLPFSLLEEHVIGFRVHPDNPGWSYLDIFNLITFQRRFFPNKFIITSSKLRMWTYILGTTIQPTTYIMYVCMYYKCTNILSAICSYLRGWQVLCFVIVISLSLVPST